MTTPETISLRDLNLALDRTSLSWIERGDLFDGLGHNRAAHDTGAVYDGMARLGYNPVEFARIVVEVAR